MANSINAAFNSLNNDDFFFVWIYLDVIYLLQNQVTIIPPQASYENNIAQNFNLLSEELNYDNDSNPKPSSHLF